jgi:hypothetical protein
MLVMSLYGQGIVRDAHEAGSTRAGRSSTGISSAFAFTVWRDT